MLVLPPTIEMEMNVVAGDAVAGGLRTTDVEEGVV
jgi:hypothetical protein